MPDTETLKPERGRPRAYKNHKEFEAKVEEYFESATIPSITGIAYHLGFSDRESFSTYEAYGEDFSRTVKRARMRIEKDRIERLNDKQRFSPGTIFDLKNNYGWVDKQEMEVTVNHEDRLDRIRNRINGRREQPAVTH
jgi:hypothetical protein